MSDFVPVNEPLLNGNEKKYLIQCIDSGWISSDGPFVSEFEKKFASRVNRKHAIAVTNGTTAIDLAIEVLDIRPGDEVIMPTFTIISCILQIIRLGATPVFVDSDSNTWNMDVTQIEKKITKKTKAIMMVHIYGLPVDINPLLEIANRHNIKVIEDAAEMHGQNYFNLPCGSFGDISTFSFYANKNITTGEGGMVVTDSDDLAEKCRSLRNLCFSSEKRFVHTRLGWNMRMTNLQAAVGLAQLERLDEFVAKKRSIGDFYNKAFENISALKLPEKSRDYSTNIYWVYGLVIRKNIGLDAAKAMKELLKRKIGTRPFFYPMHSQPYFVELGMFKGETYPVAENLYNRGFYIPSGLALTESQMTQVSNAILEIFT